MGDSNEHCRTRAGDRDHSGRQPSETRRRLAAGRGAARRRMRMRRDHISHRGAAGAIARIRSRFPEILLGAGTVLTAEQAETAISAGAEFIVAPGTNPTVVDYCLSKGVTIFPGVCTPTEIEMALSKGVDTLKFFPAEPMGGVKFLQAICAPYKNVRFIPTGGIDAKNIGQYLALPQVVACGGSWMVKPELFEAGDFAKVKHLAGEAVALARAARLGRY